MQDKQQLNVKITMIDNILQILAPNHCCGCGRSGTLLCPSCKENIILDKHELCLSCISPCGQSGICSSCSGGLSYSKAWFVDLHEGPLRDLIDDYKFQRAKSAHKILVDLLDSTLPQLPANTLIIPVPTIRAHIRQRGYDHTLLLAGGLAKRHGLELAKVIGRRNNSVQLGSSAAKREIQAREAFVVQGEIDPGKNYLLLDDIMTTGSTIKHATRLLKKAGAQNIWVAILARHKLESPTPAPSR